MRRKSTSIISTPCACSLSVADRGDGLQSAAMKKPAPLMTVLFALAAAMPAAAHEPATPARIAPDERLGPVSFPVSCSPSVRASFNRGVALLHDFWYQEAQRQFELILAADPPCAMAHWGVAMSIYHQIWERPNAAVVAKGWSELQAAALHAPK